MKFYAFLLASVLLVCFLTGTAEAEKLRTLKKKKMGMMGMMSMMGSGGKMNGLKIKARKSKVKVRKTASATYTCEVTTLWSSSAHPKDYPVEAHLSPPVLIAHNGDFMLFKPGELASAGVKMVAETGGTTDLMTDLAAAGDAIESTVVGVPQWNADLSLIPGTMPEEVPAGHIIGRKQTIEGVMFTPSHYYFSAITMLAPSPDWFTGGSGVPVVSGGKWLKSFTLYSLPYDAGTDSGMTFKSADQATTPFEPISMDFGMEGIFVGPNGKGKKIYPVVSWSCYLADYESA